MLCLDIGVSFKSKTQSCISRSLGFFHRSWEREGGITFQTLSNIFPPPPSRQGWVLWTPDTLRGMKPIEKTSWKCLPALKWGINPSEAWDRDEKHKYKTTGCQLIWLSPWGCRTLKEAPLPFSLYKETSATCHEISQDCVAHCCSQPRAQV